MADEIGTKTHSKYEALKKEELALIKEKKHLFGGLLTDKGAAFVIEMGEKIFIDTNILVYAYDKDSGKKHAKAKEIILKCLNGEINLYVSNQVLCEFVNVAFNKLSTSLPENELKEIIFEINKVDNWKKINYSNKTLESVFSEKGSHFWDKLIAATMKENNVFTIYTENTKDFKEMFGIKAVNPL